MWAVACLRDVIVECDDWPGEIEWRVHGIGEVVAERKVCGFGGDGDTVTFGEI